MVTNRSRNIGRRSLPLVALLWCACSSGPPPASAPQPSTLPASDIARFARAMPARIDAFSLADREVMRGGNGDMIFRYRDTSSVNLSVIVYPAESPERRDTGTPRERVDHEGHLFLEILPIQVQRGLYQSYETLVAHPDSLTPGVVVPGYFVAARVQHRGRTYYELQHLHLIGGDFVKVRATIVEAGWPRADVERFDSTLVETLIHR
jgi:hypothetical protein